MAELSTTTAKTWAPSFWRQTFCFACELGDLGGSWLDGVAVWSINVHRLHVRVCTCMSTGCGNAQQRHPHTTFASSPAKPHRCSSQSESFSMLHRNAHAPRKLLKTRAPPLLCSCVCVCMYVCTRSQWATSILEKRVSRYPAGDRKA